MTYTTLQVSDAGVVLFAAHRARLCCTPTDEAAFDAWARNATPGIYALRLDAGRLSVEVRPASRLVDGMPTRLKVSPMTGRQGPLPKPAPPSLYSALREDGVATLLTDKAGAALYESCAAAVMAWDGSTLVLVPEESPRVASLAEACIAAALPHRRAPVAVEADWPLLLANAVAVAAPHVRDRARFPAEARAQILATLVGTTQRPLR